jgi:hypothetical protein
MTKREPKQVTEAQYGDHPIFADPKFGHQGGYFAGVQDLREWCHGICAVPETVNGATPLAFSLSAGDVVEMALQEHHDDAHVDSDEVARLQTLLDEWCAKQDVLTWEYDGGVVVVLNPSTPSEV